MRKFLALALAWALCLATPVYAESVTASGAPNIQFLGTRITSSQTVTSGTPTRVQLNSIAIDSGGYWDAVNYYYKPLVAGKYLACGSAYGTGTTVTYLTVTLSKNGVTGSGGTELAEVNVPSAAQNVGASVPCTLVSMNGSTDWIELDVSVTGTGTTAASSARSTTQMSIRWVSP